MFVDRQFLRRQQLFLLWISISGWSLLSGLTGSTQVSDLSLNIGIPSASTQASDLRLNICIPSAYTQANDLSLNIYTVTTVAQSISLSDRFYIRRINTHERGCIMTLLCHWPLEIYVPRTGSPPCTYSSASLAKIWQFDWRDLLDFIRLSLFKYNLEQMPPYFFFVEILERLVRTGWMWSAWACFMDTQTEQTRSCWILHKTCLNKTKTFIFALIKRWTPIHASRTHHYCHNTWHYI